MTHFFPADQAVHGMHVFIRVSSGLLQSTVRRLPARDAGNNYCASGRYRDVTGLPRTFLFE